MTSTASRVQVMALLFSVAVHLAGAGLALIVIPDTKSASHTAQVATRQITIELIQSQSEPEPEIAPEPIKKSTPETQVKPLAVAKTTQRSIQKTKPEKKKIRKKAAKPNKESIQRKKNIASSPFKAKQKSVAKNPATESVIVNYFSLLQAHIESRKYYPRSARKQGIEGQVEVSFRLLKNGAVDEIQCNGAHRVLTNAASRAIKKSLPLPVPPSVIDLPKTIHFSMHYDLKRR
ncbi:MAG: TonB family protein [Gammaproteobacteria bacterium]|nr:TonB family protein [Gammaproteobacteria bacterium]MDX2487320.1 TonB family protein [Gammaproteobacteria bacterium]